MIERKRLSIETLENRYKTGILKLNKADEQMSYLKQELLRLQPELVRTSLETSLDVVPIASRYVSFLQNVDEHNRAGNHRDRERS